MPLTIVIDLDPNIIRLGPLLITWHGVFSVLGIIAAARLGFWLLERNGVELKGGGGDGLAWMVIVGLIGARLLYVWENFRIFANGQLLRMFALTEGGISQWGGLFGAMLGAFIWARRSKFSYWKMIDAGGPATMIGLAIGRIGDVINGEHHGTPCSFAWCVRYTSPSTLGQSTPVHPIGVYDGMLMLTIFLVLFWYWRRARGQPPESRIYWAYLLGLGAGRFVESFVRDDPVVLFGLQEAHVLGLVYAVAGALMLWVLSMRTTRPNRL